MSTPAKSLTSRHADLTHALILEAAVALLKGAPVSELSVRSVARQAGMSERTVFRYFATRDALLDAVAVEVTRRLATPPPPKDLAELLDYARVLYSRFDAESALATAVLYSELYSRVRKGMQARAVALRDLIDRLAPRRPEHERRLVAANVAYHLIATTWHYYRYYYGFSLQDSVESARLAIVQSLQGLGIKVPGARKS
jgi:AcrR family transcriptional regulator